MNAHLQQPDLAPSSTVELARSAAVAAVAKVLMQMVLPVLLKMSKAAVRKTLQDKQVGIVLSCVKQQPSKCSINTLLHEAVCSCASCKPSFVMCTMHCGAQAKTTRSLAVSASSVEDTINHIGQVNSQLFVSRLPDEHPAGSVPCISYSNYACLAILMRDKCTACSID